VQMGDWPAHGSFELLMQQLGLQLRMHLKRGRVQWLLLGFEAIIRTQQCSIACSAVAAHVFLNLAASACSSR
jgi:hypothetical protein